MLSMNGSLLVVDAKFKDVNTMIPYTNSADIPDSWPVATNRWQVV
jgi:hypothetical protein